jgi:hypothetical protein
MYSFPGFFLNRKKLSIERYLRTFNDDGTRNELEHSIVKKAVQSEMDIRKLKKSMVIEQYDEVIINYEN